MKKPGDEDAHSGMKDPPSPLPRHRLVLHDFLTAVVAYGSTILIIKLGPFGMPFDDRERPFDTPQDMLFAFGGIVLMTLAYGLAPLGLFAAHLRHMGPSEDAPPHATKERMAMSIWFSVLVVGVPMALLFVRTLTPVPLLAILHVYWCPKGVRLWRFLSYGSVSCSLFLLILFTNRLTEGTPLILVAGVVAFHLILQRIQARLMSRHFIIPFAGSLPS